MVDATSFTAAALIGTVPPLEAQAIASPAARLRKKSVLRMNTSPEVPLDNDNVRCCSEAHVYASMPCGLKKIDVYLFQAKLEQSYDNS